MKLALGALAALVLLYGLHRVALWAERRGWIYYRRRRGTSAALGNALLNVQSLVEPSRKHVLEERVKETRHDDESGDPPETGPEADAR